MALKEGAGGEEKVQTIRRRFDEAVLEVKQLLLQRKEIIPHPLTEGVGNPVEMFTKDYSETVAEIHRLELVKKMGSAPR